MSDLTSWLDSMCNTFGFGSPQKAEAGGMAKVADEATAAVSDHRLENLTPEACEGGTPGQDPYDPAADRTRAGLKQRAQAMKPRMDAITRKVHGLIEAGETDRGRPKDPALLAVYNEQIDVGARVANLYHRIDSYETSEAENRLITAELRLNQLECRVAAL